VSVRILLNENFPAPSVQPLRDAGLDVLAIAESCSGMKDPEVLELAVAEQRWLVTFDRDYGELIFARKNPAPSAVILFRGASYRPEEPAEWMLRLLQNREECPNKFVIFDGETSRSRSLLRGVVHGTE
jgi:predicted nuclease of predicted toxin-antitoxin system